MRERRDAISIGRRAGNVAELHDIAWPDVRRADGENGCAMSLTCRSIGAHLRPLFGGVLRANGAEDTGTASALTDVAQEPVPLLLARFTRRTVRANREGIDGRELAERP